MSEKNEKNVSQVQQTQDFWKKSMEETVARMGSGFEELAKLEQMATDQARVALNDMARLSQEGLTYAGKLSSEWRRLSLDAFKRGAELLTPRS